MLSPVTVFNRPGGDTNPEPADQSGANQTDTTEETQQTAPPPSENSGSGDTTTQGPQETTRTDQPRLEARVPAPPLDDASRDSVVEAQIAPEPAQPSRTTELDLARASAEAYQEQARANVILDRISTAPSSPTIDILSAEGESVAASLNPLESGPAATAPANQDTTTETS